MAEKILGRCFQPFAPLNSNEPVGLLARGPFKLGMSGGSGLMDGGLRCDVLFPGAVEDAVLLLVWR